MANSLKVTNKITKSVIAVENITKEDINFPEFCFGLIGKVPLHEQPDELIFVDKLNPDANISISKSRYGLPTQFTRDLRLALTKIALRKNRFSSEKTDVNANELLTELGISKSGANLALLKKHLDILTGTRIKFVNSFFNKAEGVEKSRVVEFSILSGYDLVEFRNIKGKKRSENPEDFEGSFMWQQYFYENSIKNARNLIDLDYSFYKELEGDITKQLYSFLNKRRFRNNELRIELAILGYEKLGISRTNNLSKVRFQLKKCHKDLCLKGFLPKMPELIKTADRRELVVYSFREEGNDLQETLLPANPAWEAVKEQLIELSYTEGQVGKLMREYTFPKVQDALELLALETSKGKIKYPKKWLYACLKNDFNLEEVYNQRTVQTLASQEQSKLTEQQLQEQENQLKQLNRDIALNSWIEANAAEYHKMCVEYVESLESKNQFVYQQLQKAAAKKGETALEHIKGSSFYSMEIRSLVWLKYFSG